MEESIIILLCITEVLLFVWVIYRFFRKSLSKKNDKNRVYKKTEDNKEVLEKYRKISMFSDVIMFVPGLLMYTIMIVSSFLIYIYGEKEAGVILVSVMTMFFIIIDIYCAMRVIKYNRFISESILLQGKIIDAVSMHIEQRYGWAVDVWYQYIDPMGKEHKKKQTAQMFGNFYFEQQLIQWRFLYYKDSKVSVIVNANDYNDSYLPMREDFCKFYNRYYSVDLRNFNEW